MEPSPADKIPTLLDVVTPTDEVTADDGTVLTLRGLNSTDVSILMVKHGPALRAVYGETFAPILNMMAKLAAKGTAGGGTGTSAGIMTRDGVQVDSLPKMNIVEGSGLPPDDTPTPLPSAADMIPSPDDDLDSFDPSTVSVDAMLEAITTTAPEAVADIIALANRTYHLGGAIIAAELGIACQWHALSVVAKLTFASEKTTEKLMGMVWKIIMAGQTPQIPPEPSPQP